MLKQAFAGVRRFNAFQGEMGISRSRLQDRLDRLVEHCILVKRRPEQGAYEEYRLTEKGFDLYPVLMAIRDWGDAYMAPYGAPVRYEHRGCSGEAHVRLACDACGTTMTARDVSVAPGPGWPSGDYDATTTPGSDLVH